jgi:hypothetical protein
MSDSSQGEGWWMASDGKWYPPESHPAYVHQRPSSPTEKSVPTASPYEPPADPIPPVTAAHATPSARVKRGPSLPAIIGIIVGFGAAFAASGDFRSSPPNGDKSWHFYDWDGGWLMADLVGPFVVTGGLVWLLTSLIAVFISRGRRSRG